MLFLPIFTTFFLQNKESPSLLPSATYSYG